MHRSALILLILFFVQTAEANSLGVTGSLIALRSQPKDNFDTNYSPQTSLGGGLSLDYSVEPWGLELGANLIKRQFGVNQTTIEANFLQVVGLMRFWVTENIGLGAGAYYAVARGNIQLTVRGNKVKINHATARLKKTDNGPVASLLLKFPINEEFQLVFDPRFTVSFRNAATVGTFRYLDYVIHAGIRWGDSK